MSQFEYDGRHLMIDAITGSPSKIVEATLGVNFLEAVVRRIDMTMILPPVTVKFPHATSEMERILERLEAEGLSDSDTAHSVREDLHRRESETYGYSSFVMIAESHMSIHTFPEMRYVSFDCYSCKYFDSKAVVEMFESFFDVTKMNVQIAKRRVPDAD
ncbi:MAG: S-adenosylmethionine decarboxylase [Myxococcota bacterium]|nr:S-adenosylmethionine decarboxylase [Myxococcota bacterium]